MADDVEDVREGIAREVARTSARHVAKRLEMDHTAVALFAKGRTQRPQGDTLDRMRALLDADARARARASDPARSGENAALAYFAGRADEARALALTLADRLGQLVAEMRSGDVAASPFGAPRPLTEAEHRALDEAQARLDAARAAERAAADRPAARRRRRVG